MESIYIPHLLKRTGRTQTIEFEESIADLETLTPVRGKVKVTHQGNYLEVKAKAETIVTLTCHRCLKQYNHRLKIQPSELIWLDETSDRADANSGEIEVALEDLVETLSPNGHFEPTDWIYEQLCLELPHKQLCDARCEGILLSDGSDGNESTESAESPENSETLSDSRWASLAALKQQLR